MSIHGKGRVYRRTLDPKLLAERWAYFPLLRLLLLKPWFRLAFLAFVILVVFLGLFLPKIYRVTPEDFKPVVKISGLDMTQAWALQRAALKARAAGTVDREIYCWRAAVANNPSRPELCRELLTSLLRNDDPTKYFTLVLGQTAWLLHLTYTNQADLELSTKTFEHYLLDEFTLGWLDRYGQPLSPALEKAYLKALFNTGRNEAFNDRWRKSNATLKTDPELVLYEAAYQLAWGSFDTVAQAAQRLETAKRNSQNPELRKLAHHLQLVASASLGDIDGYRDSLQHLIEAHWDKPSDHANYWRMLYLVGRKTEALKLAQSFGNPPNSAEETVLLAEMYAALGLRETARRFLERFVLDFGQFERVWLVYARILMDDQLWQPLTTLALQMRQDSRVQEVLFGYSYFLEGRAAYGLNRPMDAVVAFKRILDFDNTKNPAQVMYMAESLIKFGRTTDLEVARELLLQVQSKLDKQPDYWLLVLRVADGLKQDDLVMKSTEAMYRLNPEEFLYRLNYASALISRRQQAGEAIRLTLAMVNDSPDILAAQVLHGQALLLNHRDAEAVERLKQILPYKLSPAEQAAYHLAWFQVHLDNQQYVRAQEEARLVDRSQLLPSEIQWLEQGLKLAGLQTNKPTTP